MYSLPFDMIEHKLMLSLKQLDLVAQFNSLNIFQTRDYIELSCSIYINKILEKHLTNWMENFDIPVHRPMSLSSKPSFMKSFLVSEGTYGPVRQ